MRVRPIILLVAAVQTACSLGSAQIVYSNNFALGGTTNIWGTAPTVANSYAGGFSSATWNDALGVNDPGALLANGSDTSTQGDSWILPFNPQSGFVYTLTASLTFSGNPGNWVGVGFAQNDSVNVPVGVGRFADSGNGGPCGYDFLILNESSGNVQYFTGPRGNSPAIFNGTGFTGGPQTLTVEVILNTTGSLWSMTAYVNGVQLGSTTTYATVPPIGAVGLTQTSLGAPADVQWNYLSLQAVGSGPATRTINATVSFSPANAGLPLNPAFGGLSYEKSKMTTIGFFYPTNTALINLFSMIGPVVLRIGGGTVDTTGWGGISNTYPITASEVDYLAGFMKALPTNWSVIYGINLLSNTPANCAAEAAYVANALGPRLLGFQIGNEPEYGFTQYSAYLARWRPMAAAITNAVPGWAVTNGGNGWTFSGADGGQGQLAAFTDPFASDESGIVSMVTQHYYRAGPSTNDTMQFLFQPDSFLVQLATNIVTAAAGHCPLGARIDETGSYSAGGVANVSNAFGAALWSLDFMFTAALNGLQGVNFHGGGQSPYSPIVDNGTTVTLVGPEFYALKMLSLIPPGNVIPAMVTPASNTNFTAYGVRQAGGAISVVLNNKDTSDTEAVSVNLGQYVTGAQLIELTGPTLYTIDGYTLGGATINPDGSWNGGVQAVLTATNGQLTVIVPPICAFLLRPILSPPEMAAGLNGSQLLTLSWPTNYIGWQVESNSTGLTTANWYPVAGSGNVNRLKIQIQPGQSSVFYRLMFP
ncbi:MAG TPA: glycosyl hydrolase family 79 C-terminal domain-containing protein [Verrucomicrobiae bacterium]|nr:glycosyl hydrolase family 79 C-terminal domain-containing protein [Verrucomicrobiae bacterium]